MAKVKDLGNEIRYYALRNGSIRAKQARPEGGYWGGEGPTNEVARTRLEASKLRASAAPAPRAGGITLGAYALAWLRRTNKERMNSLDTGGNRERVYRLHVEPFLGHVPLKSLKRQAIRDWDEELAEAGRSAGMRGAAMAIVKGFIRDAAAEYADTPQAIADVTFGLRSLKWDGEVGEPFAPDVLRAILEAVRGDAIESMFALAIDKGPRVGEIFGVRVEDMPLILDLTTKEVRWNVRNAIKARLKQGPPKHNSFRELWISPLTVQLLRAHLMRTGIRSGLIYRDKDGRPLRASTFRQGDWARVLQQAGVPCDRDTCGHSRDAHAGGRKCKTCADAGRSCSVFKTLHFHSFRHSFAVQSIQDGVSMDILSKLLGHANTSITEKVYMKWRPDRQREHYEQQAARFPERAEG
ncbi:MAG: hypothetical protein NVSMB64_18880 [Candidatus Velthaea sp.]